MSFSEQHAIDEKNVLINEQALEKQSYAQLQRLRFIDFCLEYFGQLSRADLLQQFKTGVASATRDLALYRDCAPGNMVLRHQTKLHYRTAEFTPLFAHDADDILRRLGEGQFDGLKLPTLPGECCVDALRLMAVPSDIVATLMRAIAGRQAVTCEYASLSSGVGRRELVPHALANNGHRWHARCYDRNTHTFRDFVCSRFLSLRCLEGRVSDVETATHDVRWNRLHHITLIPHPKLRHPRAIALDYGMQNGTLHVEIREALLGYVARQWRIDCSSDRHLDPTDFPMALAKPEVVYDLEDTSLLPGLKNEARV